VWRSRILLGGSGGGLEMMEQSGGHCCAQPVLCSREHTGLGEEWWNFLPSSIFVGFRVCDESRYTKEWRTPMGWKSWRTQRVQEGIGVASAASPPTPIRKCCGTDHIVVHRGRNSFVKVAMASRIT
jgi:hypothetical protein